MGHLTATGAALAAASRLCWSAANQGTTAAVTKRAVLPLPTPHPAPLLQATATAETYVVALTNLAECVAAQAVVPSPPAQPSPVPEPSPQAPTGPINFSYDCFGVVLSQCCQAGAPDRCEAGREKEA